MKKTPLQIGPWRFDGKRHIGYKGTDRRGQHYWLCLNTDTPEGWIAHMGRKIWVLETDLYHLQVLFNALRKNGWL